ENEDAHLLSTLRIPISEHAAEFDAQILALTKIFVDSLNEAKLPGVNAEGQALTGSINRFHQFLSEAAFTERDRVIGTLQKIQSLRSSGVAHRKGDKYRKAIARANPEQKKLPSISRELFTEIIAILELLGAHFNP